MMHPANKKLLAIEINDEEKNNDNNDNDYEGSSYSAAPASPVCCSGLTELISIAECSSISPNLPVPALP